MRPVDGDPLAFALLNDWQRGFPLVQRPYAVVAARHGVTEAEVIERYRRLGGHGSLSRIGGVFAAGAGGAGLLCALAVPPQRLEAVAAQVSAEPAVNHNYEREHPRNLWFVVTGPGEAEVHATVDALEARCGLQALRLPMLRPYRIDLGFDLRGALAGADAAPARRGAPVAERERGLAARVEDGLPLAERPYDDWARELGRPPAWVTATLARWLAWGTLRRFGTIVRHHELGFAHNAMAVFDVPDAEVDACGAALARQGGVTLAYRRRRHAAWHYNLYAMVHGRDRDAVQAAVAAAAAAAGLGRCAHELLFSRRRFKQTGARYFRATAPQETPLVPA